MNNHSFNINIACKLGIEKAILLENMAFWLTKNIANNANFIDGNYWTYNTAKAFYLLFPYMSERSISRYLKSLEDDGYILIGNFNKHNYDRTPWYCFTNKAYELFNIAVKVNDNPIRHFGERNCQNGDINNMNTFKDFNSLEVLKTAICQNGESICQNGESIRQSGETIPDINTNINTNKKEKEDQEKKEEGKNKDGDKPSSQSSDDDQNSFNKFFESAWSKYPKKVGKTKVSKTQKEKLYKLGDELFRCIERYTSDADLKINGGWKELQGGDRFFNKTYVEYLDKEFKEQEIIPVKSTLQLKIEQANKLLEEREKREEQTQ